MRRLLFLALAAFTIAACEDDSSGPGGGEVEGTYQLVSVGSQPMPFVLVNEPSVGYRFEWVSASLAVNSNGQFREIDTYRETDGPDITTQVDTIDGTWTINSSNRVTLSADDEEQGTLSISGQFNGDRELTFSDQGFVFLWRK